MSLDTPHLAENISAEGFSIGVIVSRFNHAITDILLEGALNALKQRDAREEDICIVHVPGAFEIGTIAAAMAESGRYDAVVCLGCVLRGDTAHFDYVCQGVTAAVGSIALRGDIGVGFGVLTVDHEVQAMERLGGTHGHKGEEAALTAIEMAHLLKQLETI